MKEIIGKNIKLLREQAGLNQESLAELIRISQSNMSKYERGELEISVGILITLSKVFDVSLDEICKGVI